MVQNRKISVVSPMNISRFCDQGLLKVLVPKGQSPWCAPSWVGAQVWNWNFFVKVLIDPVTRNLVCRLHDCAL